MAPDPGRCPLGTEVMILEALGHSEDKHTASRYQVGSHQAYRQRPQQALSKKSILPTPPSPAPAALRGPPQTSAEEPRVPSLQEGAHDASRKPRSHTEKQRPWDRRMASNEDAAASFACSRPVAQGRRLRAWAPGSSSSSWLIPAWESPGRAPGVRSCHPHRKPGLQDWRPASVPG